MEDSSGNVCLLYSLLCCFCTADPASFYSGGTDQRSGSQFPSDCLSGSAVHGGQFPDQLYTAGYGERDTVGNPDFQQAGTFKCAASDYHECGGWPLWNDLDTADRGTDHASCFYGDVYAYLEET